MAIYRPPSKRWPAIAAAAIGGLLVGLVAGLLLSGGDDPIAATQAIRAEMTRAAGSLEVAAIEYEEALESGSDSELQGARDALSSSRATWESVRPAVATIAPATADEIDERYEDLNEAFEQENAAEEVLASIDALVTLLKVG